MADSAFQDWLVSDSWQDFKQQRAIREIEFSLSDQRAESRALRSQLSRVQGSIEQRLSRLITSFDAFVELSDLRAELAGFDEAARARYRMRQVLAFRAGAAPALPAAVEDVDGYWLSPAAAALAALARGDDASAELERAAARDHRRTALLMVMSGADLDVRWVSAAFPELLADTQLTAAERGIWTAAAEGLLGDAALEVVAGRLASLVGGLGEERRASLDRWLVDRVHALPSMVPVTGVSSSSDRKAVAGLTAGARLAALRQWAESTAPVASEAGLPIAGGDGIADGPGLAGTGVDGVGAGLGPAGVGVEGVGGGSGPAGAGAEGVGVSSNGSGLAGVDGVGGGSGLAGAEGVGVRSNGSGLAGVEGAGGGSGPAGAGAEGVGVSSNGSGLAGVDGVGGGSGLAGAEGVGARSNGSGLAGVDGAGGGSGLAGAGAEGVGVSSNGSGLAGAGGVGVGARSNGSRPAGDDGAGDGSRAALVALLPGLVDEGSAEEAPTLQRIAELRAVIDDREVTPAVKWSDPVGLPLDLLVKDAFGEAPGPQALARRVLKERLLAVGEALRAETEVAGPEEQTIAVERQSVRVRANGPAPADMDAVYRVIEERNPVGASKVWLRYAWFGAAVVALGLAFAVPFGFGVVLVLLALVFGFVGVRRIFADRLEVNERNGRLQSARERADKAVEQERQSLGELRRRLDETRRRAPEELSGLRAALAE
ncbi:hypothetical protein [Dactylosporangium sp. CS-033363]|uniref:hypothetical protein n=1 Tax=Dactylosporangium sp. CS-033363 TaxID=3239935 RepID=UPI003D94D977